MTGKRNPDYRFIAREELSEFNGRFKNFPQVPISSAEDFYYEVFDYYEKLSDELYEKFCKPNTDLAWYVRSMIHESGSFASNVINGLGNYAFYYKNDIRRAEEIRKKVYHGFYMFCLMIESLENLRELTKGE